MNTEFITKPKTKAIATGAYRGLSVGAIIWIYATFATKDDLNKVRETNSRQWMAISDLRVAVGVQPTTNTTERLR